MKRLIRKADDYNYNPSKIVEESDYKANQLVIDFAQTTLPDEVNAINTLVDYFSQMEGAVRKKMGEKHANKIRDLHSDAEKCLKSLKNLQVYYDEKKDYITNMTDGLVASKLRKKTSSYIFTPAEVEAITNQAIATLKGGRDQLDALFSSLSKFKDEGTKSIASGLISKGKQNHNYIIGMLENILYAIKNDTATSQAISQFGG